MTTKRKAADNLKVCPYESRAAVVRALAATTRPAGAEADDSFYRYGANKFVPCYESMSWRTALTECNPGVAVNEF